MELGMKEVLLGNFYNKKIKQRIFSFYNKNEFLRVHKNRDKEMRLKC